MEKILKLYTYVDGVNDIPFPNINSQVEVYTFNYDTKRMGGAPLISGSILYPTCLDNAWNGKQYVSFNGEKYFIKHSVPSSSYSNEDSRYKHDVEFVSERIILDNIYFFDVVTDPTDNDKYVSNSSKVNFFGDIHEFATRLNYSLKYSKADYSVVVDEGISTEAFMMSFEDQFFSQVLQSIFEIYQVPYYYVGKVVHIGFTNNAITRTFKYGAKDALLSISKTNANYKIVNRITGIGSADNIPYYYPNPSDDRTAIEAAGGTWITPSVNLMPPIYRESLGAERFYNAKNNTYISPETGEYYIFDNQYVDGNPKEHKVSFENIKPTIKEMVNAAGLRIDIFEAFDYDANDNDDIDDEGNYIHPYFFGKLRKFDGNNGFNLFDHAIDKGEMIISMTSGNCGACNWIIGVDEETQKNPVQVHTNGELLRDKDGNVLRSGTPQEIQQNTQNNSVWIALKKDIESFGVVMPNATNNYKPTAKSDTFVILNIDLPQAYITSAENKLKEEMIKYMATNNSDKFTFSVSFSRIFFAENPDILSQLNENARLQVEYNSKLYELYISSYSYKMSSNETLPQITVELADTLTINKGTLQTSIDAVKQDIMSSMGGGDILKQGLRYFIRKDIKDYAKFVSFRDGIDIGNFESLLSGGTFRKDIDGKSYIEVDRLYVRLKAIFENLEIKRTTYVGGEQIASPASMKCIKVEDKGTFYRCYYLSEQDGRKIENEFVINDQAICKESNLKSGSNVSNRYYWRLVVGVGDGYIDLSKENRDPASNDAPMAGDDIVQLGNTTDATRQKAIIQSTVSLDAPSIKLLAGINSFSLEGKAIISQGFDSITGKATFNVYGDTYIGNRDGSSFIRYTPENGVEINGTLSVGTKFGEGGNTLLDSLNKATQDAIDASTNDLADYAAQVTKDLGNLQEQIDGAIETWFYDPVPTLTNEPAKNWATDAIKNQHLGDLYYSGEGKSYRFQMSGNDYIWQPISDSDITKALAEAKKAQDTADGKRKVFVRQPSNAEDYAIGDLWVNATYSPTYSNDLLRAKIAKDVGAAFNISHWELASKYTDDTKANEALKSADDAQASADEANALLSDIASDNKLTATEKQETKKEWDIIVSEKPKNYNKATSYGVSTTVYNNAYDSLNTYITPLLTSLNTTSDIVGTTFRNMFKTYYDARTDLLNAIYDAVKRESDLYTDDKISNIEIGGRNLLPNSNFSKPLAGKWGNSADGNYKLTLADGNGYLKIVGDVAKTAAELNSSWSVAWHVYPYDFNEATEYTLSFIAYSLVPCTLFFRPTGGGISTNGGSANITTTVSEYKMTFKNTTYNGDRLLGFVFDQATTLFMDNVKLEKGNIATGWTPAIEDVQADIDAAQQAADDAQDSANTANNNIADIASDNKLSPVEKSSERARWNEISSEKSGINAQAVKYNLTSENSLYNSAFQSLATYLNGGTAWSTGIPLWLSDPQLNVTTSIVGSTYRNNWGSYFTARQNLLNAIYSKAKEIGDNAQSTADAAKNRLDSWAADGVISPTEKQSLKDEIARIDADKNEITNGYTKYALGTPTAYNTAHTNYRAVLMTLSASTPENITIPSDFATKQSAYYTQRTQALNVIATAAKKSADDAQASADEANSSIAGYSYLKEALDKGTTVTKGGLILSSNVTLGKNVGSTFTVYSGLNGIYDTTKPGGGIAFWSGGSMKDIAEDYPLPWNNVPNPSDPSKYATSVIRMDGTVYHAKGNFWIDIDGKVHCDPLSFFVGEQQVGDILSILTPVRTGSILVGARQNVPFEDGTGKGLVKFGKFTLKEDPDGNITIVKEDGSNVNFYVSGDISSGGWESGGGGEGGVYYLSELYDTDISSPVVNDVLQWNGTKWVNKPFTGGGSSAWADITGKPTTVAGYGITDAVTLNTAQDITANKKWTNGSNSVMITTTGTITIDITTTGGWSRALEFYGNNTIAGMFGAYGTGSALNYMYVGTTYSSAWQAWNGNGTYIYNDLVVSKQIQRAGSSSSWYNGRDNSMIRHTTANGYSPFLSLKTPTGSWEQGVYTEEYIYLTYISDTNYNASTNSISQQFKILPNGEFWSQSKGYFLNAANYSSYALPLTGGTLTGVFNVATNNVKLITVNNTSTTGTASYVTMLLAGVNKGEVGYVASTNGMYIYNYASGKYLGIKDDGTPHYQGNTLLHAGNYTDYPSYKLAVSNFANASNINFNLNQWTASGVITDIPSMSYAALFQVGYSYSRGWQIWANRDEQQLRWRPANPAGSAWDTMRTILDSSNYNDYSPTLTGAGASGTWGISITGNAASATKLQTSRTIWGQSFNGTGNVDGTLIMNVNGSSYDEGIRLNRAASTWVTITLGSIGATGTNANCWSIHRTNNNEFVIARNESSGVSGLRILQNGNIGIGTVSPSRKLHVIGDAQISTSLYAGASVLAQDGYLYSTANGNTVQIGSQNTSGCHIYNSAAMAFFFNNAVLPNTNNSYSLGSTGNRWSSIYAYGWINSNTSGLFIDTGGVKYTQKEGYPDIYCNSNELCFGSDGSAIFVNFRVSGKGIAPTTWNWKAGSSTSWATFNLGSLTSNGTIHATVGMWTEGYSSSKGQNTSDKRFKTNIRDFNATTIIRNLRPVAFKWNELAKRNSKVFDTDEIQYGLIAQEVKKSTPWAAVDNMFGDGYMGVRYEKFIPVILKAEIEILDCLSKEQKEIRNLKKKLAKIEKDNKELLEFKKKVEQRLIA